MRIRRSHRVIAILSAVIVPLGVGSIYAAEPAFASFTICIHNSGAGNICLQAEGNGNQVLTGGAGASGWVKVHESTWAGKDVWEYEVSGTTNCLQYDGPPSAKKVVTEPCSAGKASELWYYGATGMLNNDYATSGSQFGHEACLDQDDVLGDRVYVDKCSTPSEEWDL